MTYRGDIPCCLLSSLSQALVHCLTVDSLVLMILAVVYHLPLMTEKTVHKMMYHLRCVCVCVLTGA